MERDEAGISRDRFFTRRDCVGLGGVSHNLLLRGPGGNRDSWNKRSARRREACALSTVFHYRIGRTAGTRLLAGVSSRRRVHRQNLCYEKRKDHAYTSVACCIGYGSSDFASEFRGGLIMRFVPIAGVLILLGLFSCSRLGNQRPYVVVGATVAPVKTAFNADAGSVRVLMVVSPTCGACLEGASEVSQQVAGINQGKAAPLYVVWVPRRGGREKDVPAATRVIADPSAHEFWDGNNLLGEQYKQVLGWRGNAWDVYMLYGRKAEWNGDLPPTPDFFVHQTSEKGPRLDAEEFGKRVKQMLSKSDSSGSGFEAVKR